MTSQTPSGNIPQHQQHWKGFSQRCGYLGIWVLPAGVLDATPLFDDASPYEPLPSLRKLLSRDGLCYAQVKHSFGQGFYWAKVAATPDFAEAECIVLTEDDLLFACPWDIRLEGKSPARIRSILHSYTQKFRPIQAKSRSTPLAEVTPAPVVPLVAVETVEVSTDDLQQALAAATPNPSQHPSSQPATKQHNAFTLQQALLRVVLNVLHQQLAHARSGIVTQSLQACCALFEHLQQWHQITRQRFINAARCWSEESRCIVWSLTVGVPLSLLEAAKS